MERSMNSLQTALFNNAGPRVFNLHGMGIKPNTLPPNGVYIGRRTRNGWEESKWHNPYKVGVHGDLATCLCKHARYLLGNKALMADLPELRGRDLYCWCADEPCHGDLLLRLANNMGNVEDVLRELNLPAPVD